MRYNWILFIGILLPLSILSAQHQDSIFLNIDEIVVEENRLQIPFSEVSRSITIIDRQQIKQMQAQSINEILQQVAGIDIRQRGVHGVQADLSIRGGTFEQALVLINGIKMIDPQTGHHMMNLPITVADIERIEILKGPGARVYGQNAFAGAINIITKTNSEVGGVIGADIGSNGLINARASVNLPIHGYQQKISGSHNHSNGYRTNTDYQITNLFYQGEVTSGLVPLQVLGGYTARNFGANGFYGSEDFTEQYEETRTSVLSAGTELIEGKWRITPRVSWRRNSDNWQFRRSDPEFFQNFHTSDVTTGEVHTSYIHDNGILGVGVEYNNVQLLSNNLGDRSRDQIGLHLEHRWLFANDRIDLTPGIYVLNLSDFGTQVFPGLDVGYKLNNSTKIFANIGRTSRIPSFTDLFYEDRGNVGNPNLQTERAYTFEMGGKFQQSNHQLQLSYFRRAASDLIDWFKVDPEDRWTPDNFGQATYSGLDFNWTMQLSPQSYISASYLFLDAALGENDFTLSRNALENLRHQLILQSGVQLINSVNTYVSVRYNDRVNLENYTLVDAQISYDIGSWSVYIKATNLFDVEYRETNLVPMPGRWLMTGMSLEF